MAGIDLKNQAIFITGGTGSFGQAMTLRALEEGAKRVTIFSRDECKQQAMLSKILSLYPEAKSKLHFVIGCVRNKQRVSDVIFKDDIIIHAAALKQVPTAEKNPSEFIQTNIQGTENVIAAAKTTGAKALLTLSTDKAVLPLNLYGATKLCAEKLTLQANNPSHYKTTCSVLRYGNVLGSRGSVLPLWIKKIQSGQNILPVTSFHMTRFWISLEHAVDAAIWALNKMQGGEIFVPKIPATSMLQLFDGMTRTSNQPLVAEEIGIRPGEKLHETLISQDEAQCVFEDKDYYAVLPVSVDHDCLVRTRNYWKKTGKKAQKHFSFCSLSAERMHTDVVDTHLKQLLTQMSSQRQDHIV